MNEKKILRMIHQILLRAGESNAKPVLDELCGILKRDGAPKECIELVETAANNVPEACCAAREDAQLTKEDMAVAKQRGDERRHREEMEARMGRC